MLLDRDRAVELLGSLDWFDIETAQTALDQDDFWTDEWLAGAIDRAKRSQIRSLVRSIKDDQGVATFASVTTKNVAGDDVRIYKAERLFDVNDYVTTIDFHASMAKRHQAEANAYRDRGLNRHGDQLRFLLREGAA